MISLILHADTTTVGNGLHSAKWWMVCNISRAKAALCKVVDGLISLILHAGIVSDGKSVE
jgi:hypothetical protein